MRETPRGPERLQESEREISIRTDGMYTRGTIMQSDQYVVLINITYPDTVKGTAVEVRKHSIQAGQPFEYREHTANGITDWMKSLPLRGWQFWERGTFISAENLVQMTENWSASKGLSNNPLTLSAGVKETNEHARTAGAQYEKLGIAPYYYHKEAIDFATANPLEGKTNNALFKGDTGWKVHINVASENVRSVSEYLKNNYYNHKYLNGGEPGDGKVFTVYFGAKSVMDKWASQLSHDIDGQVSYPGSYDEAEVARGIVSRFTVACDEQRGGSEFDRYGAYGLSFLKDAKRPWEATREEKIADAERTYKRLQELYGAYFTG